MQLASWVRERERERERERVEEVQNDPPERTIKSTRSRPTSLKSSNKPETLRLKAGRKVSELGA
jgi:hypothetical protein